MHTKKNKRQRSIPIKPPSEEQEQKRSAHSVYLNKLILFIQYLMISLHNKFFLIPDSVAFKNLSFFFLLLPASLYSLMLTYEFNYFRHERDKNLYSNFQFAFCVLPFTLSTKFCSALCFRLLLWLLHFFFGAIIDSVVMSRMMMPFISNSERRQIRFFFWWIACTSSEMSLVRLIRSCLSSVRPYSNQIICANFAFEKLILKVKMVYL